MDPKTKNILEWVGYIIGILIIAILIKYFIGTTTEVKQVSMKPTLVENQKLWLSRWGRTTHTLPKRGEIITFEEPSKISYTEDEINKNNPVAKFQERNAGEWFMDNFLEIGSKRSFIKRVIGLPGEHVQIKDGKVYINGKILTENYLQSGVVTDVRGVGFDDFIVPENCVFAMGDNRMYSTDCRAFGCIPIEKIEGTVAFRYWPFDKFGNVS